MKDIFIVHYDRAVSFLFIFTIIIITINKMVFLILKQTSFCLLIFLSFQDWAHLFIFFRRFNLIDILIIILFLFFIIIIIIIIIFIMRRIFAKNDFFINNTGFSVYFIHRRNISNILRGFYWLRILLFHYMWLTFLLFLYKIELRRFLSIKWEYIILRIYHKTLLFNHTTIITIIRTSIFIRILYYIF